MKHCIQYAIVGHRAEVTVLGTENMTDDEVRAIAMAYPKEPVSRYNRCPECESWTTWAGKLREDIDCPAVQAALRNKEKK